MKKVAIIISLILILSVVMLTACAPKTAEEGMDLLVANGYRAEVTTGSDVSYSKVFKAMPNIEETLLAMKGDPGQLDYEFIIAAWFESASKAKNAYNDNQGVFEQLCKSMHTTFGIPFETRVEGKVIALGTVDALNLLYDGE
ncbi:MAG: hypothetical protein IKM01_02765 [Clostridia bacterium]|nr:hypothetical protein [Clostridia bacterium]